MNGDNLILKKFFFSYLVSGLSEMLYVYNPSPFNIISGKTKKQIHLKDGVYYCYCAYVLRISRHSDFLSVMLTNIGIFLRGLKLPTESRS